MQKTAVSRQSFLMCQGRAVAHGQLAVGRFDDPTADAFLTKSERWAVARARGDAVAWTWADRLESLKLNMSADVVVPCTIAIDDAIRARTNPQLVILWAGLCGRAWRMPELAATHVFEVDHPAALQDKESRSRGLRWQAASLRSVPVDFSRDDLGRTLAAAAHRQSVPTTWVWESVVPFVTRAEVTATARAVGECSAPGSRLVVHYHVPSPAALFCRLLARGLVSATRMAYPVRPELWRSLWTPAAMSALLTSSGWRSVSDDDLLTLTRRWSLLARRPRLLRNRRIAVVER